MSDSGLKKEIVQMEDGRYIIYYSLSEIDDLKETRSESSQCQN